LAAAGVPERSRALPGAGRQGSLQLRRAPLETDEVRVAQADGDKNRQLRQRICQQVKNKSVLSRISFHLLQDIPPVLAHKLVQLVPTSPVPGYFTRSSSRNASLFLQL
jgi:hypothetical protein